MSLPDQGRHGGTAAIILFAAIILLAAGTLAVQVITNRPALGPFSLIAFTAPGLVITRALGPRSMAWPLVVLVTLGATLVLLVIAGVVAGASAHGLDASSVAAVELVALFAVSSVWVTRVRRHGAPWNRPVMHIKPASTFLVVLGLGLAGAGFAVASGAAADHASSIRFVQFWSVPPSAAGPQLIGIRNATGIAVDCQIVIDPPGQQAFESQIGVIESGETWTGPLPRVGSRDTAPWQVSLHCTARDGSVFDRRLTIDPPALTRSSPHRGSHPR